MRQSNCYLLVRDRIRFCSRVARLPIHIHFSSVDLGRYIDYSGTFTIYVFMYIVKYNCF